MGENEILSYIATQIELETTLLRGISLAEEEAHMCPARIAEASVTVKLTL